MAVLTEQVVRSKISKENLSEPKQFKVKKSDIITPSAKSYLIDKDIELVYVDKIEEKNDKVIIKEVEISKEYKYETIFGAKLDYKPEHMTQLRGNILVFKDDKRILFRGKIDSLESKILEVQIKAFSEGKKELVKDLQEILDFVRSILRAEVLEEPLKEYKLQNMDFDEIREKSHNPKKHFGIGHEFPSYKMGGLVVAINSLRSLTRETELLAYETFKTQEGQVSREDIIKSLNRLSSIFWIMIFKVRTDKYK